MPTSKTFAYDNPAYLVPIVHSGSTTAGANGVSTKFGAFTAMQVRAVCVAANIASTSATQPLLYTKSGTATATATLTSVSSGVVTAYPNVLATAISLAQGDQFWLAHGTDGTVSLSVAVEAYATPGAALTAP